VGEKQELLDAINAGLREFVSERLTFPVAEELPPIQPRLPPPFARTDIQPPSGLYLSPDTWVKLDIFTSTTNVVVQFNFEILRRDGELINQQETVSSVLDDVSVTRTVKLTEGFLLSATATTPTAGVFYGHLWAAATVFPFGPGVQALGRTLFRGAVTPNIAVAWPQVQLQNPSEITTPTIGVSVAAPGAGVVQSFTLTDNQVWKLVAIHVGLTTNATVANRRVRVDITVPTGQAFTAAVSSMDQTASQFVTYTFVVGGNYATITGNRVFGPLGQIPPLTQNTIITMNTTGFQSGAGGDSFTAMTLIFTLSYAL